jgi:integration host factor subunit alpha
MTLTKEHIVRSIANRVYISKSESIRLLESVLEIIKTSLSTGEDVLVSGFGRFSLMKKAPRRGRNLQTGEDLPLDARTVVKFHCSEVLKHRINGRG